MGPRLPREDKFEYMLSPVKGCNITSELPAPSPTTPPQIDNLLSATAFEGSTVTEEADELRLTERDASGEDDEAQGTMAEDFLEEDGKWRMSSSLSSFPQSLQEPSSAIASRIMRAHDNPSPPPQMSRHSPLPESPLPTSEPAFEDIPTFVRNSEARHSPTLCERSPPSNHDRQSNATPESSLRKLGAVEAERDLISFDHSVILPIDDKPSTPPGQTSPHLRPTVDDLLFFSPAQTTRELGTPENRLARTESATNLVGALTWTMSALRTCHQTQVFKTSLARYASRMAVSRLSSSVQVMGIWLFLS